MGIGVARDTERVAWALDVLFGATGPEARGLLRRLDRPTLGAAFKRAALRTHPDRAMALGRAAADLRVEFADAREAFAVLSPLVADSPHRDPTAEPRRPPPPPATASTSAGGFHRGPIPARQLRLAELLYYSRLIPREEVVRALRWQTARRSRLGALAVAWGRLDAPDAEAVERARRPYERFGECAVRTGALSPFWVNVLLRRQQALGRPIGRYFVERGVVSQPGLEQVLDLQRRHNAASPR